ncbi:MAG: hypothetical protein ACK40M_05385 [Flavobacteriales bacterium]|nr:hypothetical protein [Flavobacteriales bacterium]HRE98007.1 hypothetical protein [Flavobacteriales bacterium]HRJ34925.1 hypothetical protein [Flavobacteriales bacterium]HRJ40082.1 hypothetical protein [Flavobacteriales bacterium]
MNKYYRFSEIMWLLLTITVTIMVVVLMISEESIEKSKWYLIIPLLSAAMYIMRRSLRIRFEKNQSEGNAKGKK